MFGLRSAPYIFNLFSEGLHWVLQRHLPALIRHYLDDFLKIFKPDTPTNVIQAALEWTRALADSLGLRFQESKIEGPATSLEYLGIELDSIAMEARLPPKKLTYLSDLLSKWQSKTHCTLFELQELTGYLQFCSQVIPFSRAFLRSLFDFATSFKSRFARRRISRPAQRDITWWRTYSSQWNGVHFISPTRPTLHLYTDASGNKGIGGVFGDQWFSSCIPHRYLKEDIQIKEFYAIIHALLCWGPQLRGKHVIFHTDNQDVFSTLKKLSIRSAPTMELLRQFLGLACQLDFTFSTEWLPSKENPIADAASRYQFKLLFAIAPYLQAKPSPKALSLKSMIELTSLRPSTTLTP
jgi:hypothetical protein